MLDPYEALGRRLIVIRRELATRKGEEVTQRRMADLLVETWIEGVSATQTQVSRWENGKARPRKATLEAYARLAGEDVVPLLRLAGYGYFEDEEIPPRESPPAAARTGVARRWLLALPAVLLVLLAWSVYRGSKPSDPTRARIEDRRLEVLAGYRRLWSMDLGAAVAPRIEPLVRDLDLDGRNEVLVSLDPVEPAAETGKLVCFGHDGTRRWEFPYGRDLAVDDRRFTPYYAALHVEAIDTPAGARLLVVARHERWFPAQVVLLDPVDGRRAAEYWHPGYLDAFATFDVDADGSVELLAGGINNPGPGPGRPALAVLDLPFRPAAEPDAVFGLTHSREHLYLLFPRPDLHHAQSELAAVLTLQPLGPDRVLAEVSTRSGNALFYYLDAGLEVADLRVSDTFVRNHDRLLDHRFSQDEIVGWRTVLRSARAPDTSKLQPP